jgi:hypothetical protein
MSLPVLWGMCGVPTKDCLKGSLWYKFEKALLLLKCSSTNWWTSIITKVTKKPNLANEYIFWPHYPLIEVGEPGTSPLYNSMFYSGVWWSRVGIVANRDKPPNQAKQLVSKWRLRSVWAGEPRVSESIRVCESFCKTLPIAIGTVVGIEFFLCPWEGL